MSRTFVGFGFGAIQAGLFFYEAWRTKRFGRLVVAEVMDDVVQAVRRGGGRYGLNIATPRGVERVEVGGVEIYNPRNAADREKLVDAVAEAAEAATALPSVKFYGGGQESDVVSILCAGLERKAQRGLPRLIIYTAENHNHAAEILEAALLKHAGAGAMRRVQCLNTVIGKMSGVVTEPAQIAEQGLKLAADGLNRAFLVEEFNRILITRLKKPEFDRAITVFEEKSDLLPFEEAKLYGHNATHALIGYLAKTKGYQTMAEAGRDATLMQMAREAFVEESGGALCRKYAGLDPLFTPTGYRAYVEDLLVRMVNPHLRDLVDRIIRDPRRKLGWDDRLVGTMRLALSQGIAPRRYAAGAAAALRLLQEEAKMPPDQLLREVWREAKAPAADQDNVMRLILSPA